VCRESAPRAVAISRTWVSLWLDDGGDGGGGDQDGRTTSTTRTSHHKTESSTEGSARARLPQPRHDGPPKCATTMRTGVRRARWRHDDAVNGVGNIIITIIIPSPDLLLSSVLRYGINSLSSYQFNWLDKRAAAGRLGGVTRLIGLFYHNDCHFFSVI